MNPKFSLQYQYLSAWLILLAIKFSFHPNPMVFYQQMTKVQYERCHKDPTNEGCDAPHQPDTSSYIINKERKLLCDKDPTNTLMIN